MIHFGAAWYPEHWPQARWKRDCELMVAAGFTTVRIAEFAWSSLEPEDGRFELGWLHTAIDCAHHHGLQVVMCTPSAAPPAWLTRLHPDILPVRDHRSGAIQPHGQRGHYDPTNATYRKYCARITATLADAVANHPAVIGWQTDNEFWSIAANPSALADFQAWCLDRYGSLDALNQAWSTAYWSQAYCAPDDLEPPFDYPNPCLYLAWHRWASQATADFQRVQIDTLRERIPAEQWIGHNFHPYDDQDRAVIAADLDLVAWDAYIFRPDHLRLDPAFSGRDADRIRDLNNRQRPFWIMETLPGFVNWRAVNRHLDPGESRTMAWHLIGHGADAVLYWQWRSAAGGQEQYHGCLLQQDGEPRPVYHEIATVGAELQRVGHLLEGTRVQPQVALIDRWCDRQALKRQPFHEAYDPAEMPVRWYRPVRAAGLDLAVLEGLDGPPSQPLVIAPQLHVVDDATAAALLRYVETGGHLLLGPRALMKDGENALRPQRQPGPLATAAATVVDEYYSLPAAIAVAGSLSGSVDIMAEWWRPTADDVEVLARFGDHPWLAGQAAVFSRAHGTGRITVCAGCPDTALATAVVEWALQRSGISVDIQPPPGVECCSRSASDGRRLVIAINHRDQPAALALPQPMRDHLADRRHEASCPLPAYAVALLSED